MGVHIVEKLAALLVLHQGPGSRPVAGGIPAAARLFRRLGKPVCAPFQQLYLAAVVEYGHMLSLFLSVVPADSNGLVADISAPAVKAAEYIVHLLRQGLLHAENVGMLVLKHHCGGRIAEGPGIGAVIGASEPYVIRYDTDFRVLLLLSGEADARQHESRCNTEKRYSFHSTNLTIFVRINNKLWQKKHSAP